MPKPYECSRCKSVKIPQYWDQELKVWVCYDCYFKGREFEREWDKRNKRRHFGD